MYRKTKCDFTERDREIAQMNIDNIKEALEWLNQLSKENKGSTLRTEALFEYCTIRLNRLEEFFNGDSFYTTQKTHWDALLQPKAETETERTIGVRNGAKF
eukprot:GHVN01047007.1.p1 GENE.GHVN01047007.1~~GHVN01047007.1.p1  ORF type:complete len:101 (-),score=6.36 GHVN01047007.1:55-357(-)